MSTDADEGDGEKTEAPAPPTWPRVVTLKHPFDFGKAHIAQLVFRRGKLGDLKGLKVDVTPSSDQILLIASRMCGQPVSLLEKLDGEDGAEVIEIALGFFGMCLVGG
jgi:tail assembly chaperone E/41/14-like protein